MRYGAGNWPGLSADKLMAEEVFAVGPPALDEKLELAAPADLSRYTLIHDLSVEPGAGFVTWGVWLGKAGADFTAQRGIRISNSAAVLQAAVDGQGIALARSIMARDDARQADWSGASPRSACHRRSHTMASIARSAVAFPGRIVPPMAVRRSRAQLNPDIGKGFLCSR